jgi:solute carrier family 35 protein C2
MLARKTIAAVIAYFVIAPSMTLLIKYILSDYHFHFPVFLLMIGFVVEWLIALTIQLHRPKSERDVPWRQVVFSLAPIGCATALEISFSCLSLLTLSVSFHVMVKSGSPIAVLMWSIALGLQKPTFQLVMIVSTVCIGIGICTWAQGGDANQRPNDFSWVGFFYIVASAFVAGFRWSASQVSLQKKKLHPITLLFYVLPPAFLTLVPFYFYLEHSRLQEYMDTEVRNAQTILMICSSVGLIGFSLMYAQLFLIEATSSLTFGICSVAKELMLIVLSVVFNGDHLSTGSIVGFSLALCGIAAYKKQKYSPQERGDFELVPNDNSKHDLDLECDGGGKSTEQLLRPTLVPIAKNSSDCCQRTPRETPERSRCNSRSFDTEGGLSTRYEGQNLRL